MRILLKVVGGLVVLLVLALVVFRITGLNPDQRRPGLWLSGTVVSAPVPDWSFAENVRNMEIQTHTSYLLPHSVTINCVTKDGQLYLVSVFPVTAPRRWVFDVMKDPRVRIRIGDDLYDRTVTPVTDQAEIRAVLEAREAKIPTLKVPEDISTAHVFHVPVA